jgi:hypothetical protein
VSSLAHRVLDNFYWRIEALTPPTVAGIKTEYFEVDPDRIAPEQSSGLTRGFSVSWNTGGADHEMGGQQVTDGLEDRNSDHEFTVEMIYSKKLGHRDLMSAMLQDRGAILKEMGNADKWIGFNASNTTTAIGLWDRICVSSERDAEDESFTVLRMVFRCAINESEG